LSSIRIPKPNGSQAIKRWLRSVRIFRLGEAFVEFIKSLAPKTMKQKLEEAKEDAAVHNQQRKRSQQDVVRKNKQWQQEM
ncbi:MAG: hypothetical protein K2L82_15645, partial [Lachnospiraceae bacterium]|nr:hypothetical protein [Lachnospiraceae bacterium]